uniref:Uncharacterized protein n=1 Tax=Anopheles arabiensis TaxID=7173 RepID=A0A182HPH6_ANOAR
MAQVSCQTRSEPPNFAIDPFDKRKSKWKRWVERLETAFLLYGVTDEQMQKNFLLHYMGPETYDIICDKVAPDSPRKKTYGNNEIVSTLETFFMPKPHGIAENYRFNCRRQGDKDAAVAEETAQEYLLALRKIAVTCNFGQKRNQLVLGIKRGNIRDRLLEKRELTLGEPLEIAVSMELSRKGSTEINGGSSRQELHAVPRRDKKGPNIAKQNAKAPGASCFRCGDKTHLANACKHKHTVCSFCMLQGHLAKIARLLLLLLLFVVLMLDFRVMCRLSLLIFMHLLLLVLLLIVLLELLLIRILLLLLLLLLIVLMFLRADLLLFYRIKLLIYCNVTHKYLILRLVEFQMCKQRQGKYSSV